MLRVYDNSRRLTGILHNAYNVVERQRLNSVGTLSFTLPDGDTKNGLCEPFGFVSWDSGQLYRIMPSQTDVNELGEIVYECEHVIATLIDQVMFGQHVSGENGPSTADAVRWLLERQNQRYDPWGGGWVPDPGKHRNWVLGDCEFNHRFEYGWEQETILHALWSVANPFTEPYRWDFDTSVYPFVLHLRRLSADPADALFIRRRKNMMRLVKTSDPSLLCTRIFPLGQGEGVNQVNIRDVNGGVPHLQSPPDVVARYGTIERVWIDRRYTDSASLRDAASAMLAAMQEPYEEYEADMAILGDARFFTPELGRLVDVDGLKRTWITGIDFHHNEERGSRLFIANKPRDIAGSIADLADRQRIEMAYAQGATQFHERDASGNCAFNAPLLLKVFIPDSMQIINFVKLDVEVSRFRLPFAVTEGGGGRLETIFQSDTTSSGPMASTGAQSQSNPSTQGMSATGIQTQNNQNTQDMIATGPQTQNNQNTQLTPLPDITVGGSAANTTFHITATPITGDMVMRDAGTPSHVHAFHHHSHRLSVTIPGLPMAHTHGMPHTHTMPHTHNMPHTHTMPHTHGMPHMHNIAHTHTLQLQNHEHRLEPGMAFHSVQPTSFDVLINGRQVQTVSATEFANGFQRDITQWLLNDQGRIQRNSYYRIEIRPNAPAHVQMTLSVQGFIHSRGDRTV